ncbi:peptidase M23 [Selenomonas sp. oral taxon 920]|uniref:M23 family metallopeptidase n=1 Tax=Selenomonas sp. oral taxon 920 TaxID=1884263 RepID=UPI000840FAE0|nr:M23 family metallopeptidase [Selenomonas sp. oral taxon 920]AOH48929.1 peptidase M23 [Selenomonas sp. oral taxon 920]
MNEEKRYKIQFIDSEEDVTRTVRLSLRSLRLIAVGAGAAVAVLAVGAVLSIYTLMNGEMHASETAQLREANRIQQEQILQVSKKASALQQDLDSLRRAEDGLRAIVGAPPAAADETVQEGTVSPTGGEQHAPTTADLSEALEMIEERLGTRRSSIDLLAETMRREFPGAASYASDSAPHTMPSIWPAAGYVSSPYGLRFGGTEFHQGIDIAADMGTPIVATADGIVTAAGWNGGYGNMVDVDHGGGIVTRYGHASALAVTVGQQVRRGEVIAYVGSTGRSTGPHVHYEVRVDGQPVNPAGYL